MLSFFLNKHQPYKLKKIIFLYNLSLVVLDIFIKKIHLKSQLKLLSITI